jgi:hypothetical protein
VIDGTTTELDLEHVLRRFVDFCLGAADDAADFLSRTYSSGCRLRCSHSAREALIIKGFAVQLASVHA